MQQMSLSVYINKIWMQGYCDNIIFGQVQLVAIFRVAMQFFIKPKLGLILVIQNTGILSIWQKQQ